jgi:MltA specific insert domain/Transposase
VKPFLKGHKNDYRDAEAIAAAVQRPTMHFVAIKTPEQMDLLALHRVRSRLVGQRTGVINQIRGFLIERGITVRQGVVPLRKAMADILSSNTHALSPRMVNLIADLVQDWRRLDERIAAVSADAITYVKTRCGGMQLRGVVATLFGGILSLTANAASANEPLKLPDSQLKPAKWSEVAGWTADDHLAAFAAYQTSCQQGFLTGYYEPVVQGSRFPSPEFHVPVYRRPPGLVAVGYKPGSKAFPNKGTRVGRRNEQNQLVPYYDRGAIEAGALDGQKLEICWLKDPFDLLALQIEGSGRVILEDGTPLRVNFDSHNGYSFTSISRALIERNLIPREEMSMHRIREWMAAHPDEAAKVRAANRSYVFFRITGLSNEGEPVGALSHLEAGGRAA